MKSVELLDRILHKAMHTGNFRKVNWILNRFVPFNTPHGIRIAALDDNSATAILPYRRKNYNHLKGIHAGAICTAGEFPAGILLITKFPFSKFRLILADLNAEYHFQGRTELRARVEWPAQYNIEKINTELENTDKYVLELSTKLIDNTEMEVATVTTTWQLKAWDKVKLK